MADGSINLNPLSLVDRLIREHGSASILRDHLGLLREQISILQTKNAELETQNAQLQNALDNYKREIDTLTQQINQEGGQTDGRRTADEEMILVHVSTREGLSAKALSRATELSLAKTSAYLSVLEETGFVSSKLNLNLNATVWHPTTAGHKYLLAHGMLN